MRKDWSSGEANTVDKDLKSYTLCFTAALRKTYGPPTYKAIETVCKRIGLKIRPNMPIKAPKDSKVVILGQEHDDMDASTLHSQGAHVYSKDLFSALIFRGRLNLDSEFRIEPGAPKSTKKGRKKKQEPEDEYKD